jgi:mono/diheme cytochrome c family protein
MKPRPLLAVFFTSVLVPVLTGAAAPDGKQVFESNCAVCHGPQGKPDPANPVLRGFERLPADFSDPLFASREPSSYWLIVATHGGPALGFSDKMPAFGEALSRDELEAVIAYVKTLAPAVAEYPPGDLNFFLGMRTKKAFPEDEVVWKVRQTTRDGPNVLQNRLEAEKRLGKRWQVSTELVHEFEGDHGNLSEIEPGFKYVAYYDLQRKIIASAGMAFAVPLNRDNATWAAVPFIAAGKWLGDSFTLQGSVRADLPEDNMSEDGSVEIGTLLHYRPPWMEPRGIFPGVEVLALMPFDRVGRDAVQVAIAPQVRLGLSKRGHVALHLGVQVPVNESGLYDFRGYAYLVWDFADGMFWEAW